LKELDNRGKGVATEFAKQTHGIRAYLNCRIYNVEHGMEAQTLRRPHSRHPYSGSFPVKTGGCFLRGKPPVQAAAVLTFAAKNSMVAAT
jgi:hypothetical protein